MAIRKLGAALLIAGGIGFAGAASAADVYTPTVEPVPTPSPEVFSWTGVYFGGGGGYNWTSFNTSQLVTYCGIELVPGPFPCDAGIDDPAGRSYGGDFDTSGWFGTVTAGFDWQVGNLVFGIFGSYDFQDQSKTSFNPVTYVDDPDFDPQGQRWNVSLGNIGTVAARAGVAVAPRVLLYGLAGWSWSSADIGYSEGCFGGGGCDNLAYSGSRSIDGWTLGVGAEVAVLRQASLRLEYRYTDFGSVSVSGDDGGEFAGRTSASITDQSIRALLTFRFGTH